MMFVLFDFIATYNKTSVGSFVCITYMLFLFVDGEKIK